MKIASRIKPRNGQPRAVHVNEHLYLFAPTKDKAGDTHYVADVADPDHAAILLGSEHFYELGKDQQAVATLTRGVAPVEETESKPVDTATDALRAAAAELLAGSANTIAVAVGKVASLDVVRVALAMEREAGGRKTVIHLLEATLQGAAAAGVKG